MNTTTYKGHKPRCPNCGLAMNKAWAKKGTPSRWTKSYWFICMNIGPNGKFTCKQSAWSNKRVYHAAS